MPFRPHVLTCLAVALVATPLAAKPAKRPAKSAAAVAKAKAKPKPAVVTETPREPGGVYIPRAVIMRPMTPAEAEANAVLTLRAGLNVAALQCFYSKFLATARSYNDLLKDQSAAFASAQATMQAHFRRYDGARSVNSYDQYFTKIYNSFSTLDAQYAFCEAAATVGRDALSVNLDDFGRFALAQVPVLRSSLTPVAAASFQILDLTPVALPPL